MALRTLAGAALGATLLAQAPSPWADLQLPNGSSSAALSALGKLVVYVEPTQVHAFSAFTRRWHRLPVAGATLLSQANDWALLQAGSTCYGFSATRGRFEPLPVGANARLLNPPTQRNDSLALVRDGGTIAVFSGLGGGWHARAFAANAAFAVQRHVALVADGTLLTAFSAYDDGWHDLVLAAPASALAADGAAGSAESPGLLHGFAATTGTWSTAAALGAGAQFLRNDDWATWYDAGQALAFSGLRGSFASVQLAGLPTVAASQDDLLALRDGTGVQLFSPLTGGWTRALLPATGNLRADVAVALLSDGLQHQAYSARTGQLAPLQLDAGAELLSANMLALTERGSGQPWLYSSLDGRWLPAPNDALPGLPELATQSALLPSATGFYAFSGRSGAFVPLASSGGTAVANVQSAVLMVWDQGFVHAFEPRLERWLRAPRSSPVPPSAQVWRTSGVAVDASEAFGFGAQAGALARTPLAEPMLAYGANSECAWVLTASHVYAFGAVPVPCSQYQFPEFRRAFVAGAPLRLQLRLPQGDLAALAIGPLALPLPLPGLGELLLQPLASLLLLPDPGEDHKRLGLPTPPALRGSEWGFQALVLPANGTAFLSDLGSVLVP